MRSAQIKKHSGKVYLVGAGPGDPELITLKAFNILQKADIIFYDSLLNTEILENSPQACEKVFVGKRLGVHSLKQDEINGLLYQNAVQGRVVVRLKGGDPFIFGRGGEEILFLEHKKIEVEVIPGVTTAVAASASLKVPLTHRDSSQSVIFLSGYTKETNQKDHLPDYDWSFLATSSLTMVFYMGLKNIKIIVKKLIEHGKSSQTGVAVISDCSMPNEVKLVTTLDNVSNEMSLSTIKFPAIILIGGAIRQKIDQKHDKLVLKKRNEDSSCLLILFHGAKKLEQSTLPGQFIQELKKKLAHEFIDYAYLTDNVSPSFESFMKEVSRKTLIKKVEVFPIFLLPGKHLDEDIPRLVKKYKKKYPHLTINLRQAPHIIRDFLPQIANLARLYLAL